MLENTFESIDDQEEMEKAAEMEIDKILFEITAGALDKAPSKVTNAVMEPESPGVMATSEDEEEEEALEAMHPSWPCFVARGHPAGPQAFLMAHLLGVHTLL